MTMPVYDGHAAMSMSYMNALMSMLSMLSMSVKDALWGTWKLNGVLGSDFF